MIAQTPPSMTRVGVAGSDPLSPIAGMASQVPGGRSDDVGCVDDRRADHLVAVHLTDDPFVWADDAEVELTTGSHQRHMSTDDDENGHTVFLCTCS